MSESSNGTISVKDMILAPAVITLTVTILRLPSCGLERAFKIGLGCYARRAPTIRHGGESPRLQLGKGRVPIEKVGDFQKREFVRVQHGLVPFYFPRISFVF